MCLLNSGLEIGRFGKNSSKKLKLKQRTLKIQAIQTQLLAILLKKLNCVRKKSNFVNQNLNAEIFKICCSKFGINLENSSSKLNIRQTHLVYFPKHGPISKPCRI